MGIDFEWTVKFGDVLTVGGAMVVGASILYKRGGYDVRTAVLLGKLTEEISELKEEMKTFAATVATIAVQESKIDLLMKWYDELRRGVGKIE